MVIMQACDWLMHLVHTLLHYTALSAFSTDGKHIQQCPTVYAQNV